MMRVSKQSFVLTVALGVCATSALGAAPPAAPAQPVNPFAKFEGEWTLKHDDWLQIGVTAMRLSRYLGISPDLEPSTRATA